MFLIHTNITYLTKQTVNVKSPNYNLMYPDKSTLFIDTININEIRFTILTG